MRKSLQLKIRGAIFKVLEYAGAPSIGARSSVTVPSWLSADSFPFKITRVRIEKIRSIVFNNPYSRKGSFAAQSHL